MLHTAGETALHHLLHSTVPTSNPVFAIYCLAVSCKVRRTGSWSRQEVHSAPLAALVSILFINLAGPLLITVFMRGHGAELVFGATDRVGIVVACWLAVFWAPGDVVYRLVDKSLLASNFITGVNAWKRARDVVAGVALARSLSSTLLLQFLYGTLSGWGGSLMFPLEGRLRNKLHLNSDLVSPSAGFLSVVASALLLTVLPADAADGDTVGLSVAGRGFMHLHAHVSNFVVGGSAKLLPTLGAAVSMPWDLVAALVIMITFVATICYDCTFRRGYPASTVPDAKSSPDSIPSNGNASRDTPSPLRRRAKKA